MPNKTLTVAIMDPPYESENATTAFRILDVAARRGYHINVFTYEGAVSLAFVRQVLHPNPVHGKIVRAVGALQPDLDHFGNDGRDHLAVHRHVQSLSIESEHDGPMALAQARPLYHHRGELLVAEAPFFGIRHCVLRV